ncbi:hypothetical protein BGZ88_008524 [Linnemannia elongata]|uniref:Adenylate cyclase-associated CAP C-terminal domain-containing protein n=1 Tax=Linnemannia elongata AG-77 TaxID=1314771 RepID=A0A197KJC0_9FUNG|nr:hypothetical protein BGZ88_008524 [Linnemannia elongata]OAQ36676.1 hypothetical protein K457DRAFT_26920 [Linnemannia elongata AG-77]
MMSVKEQANALNNSATRPNAKENATHLFKDVKSAVETIEVQDRKALYLLKCEDCEYIIQGKPIKISIESCKNLTIKVEDKVLTGTVDIWKSENINLDSTYNQSSFQFDRSVSAFQLDSIQTITIKMPEAEYFGSMVWAGVDNITLNLGDDTHSLSYSQLQARNPALRPDTDQFKTTIVDGSIKTEAIVRMDNGYPMTRAEESSLQASEKKKEEVLRGAPKADDE